MRPPASSPLRTTLVALLVLAGSYAGALAGTMAVFPGPQTAIVFPPYAVLAAALMLSPVRQWWIYVLASMAGNFWPHLSYEGLTSFVLFAEAANVSRAIVAAAGVRRFGERIGMFDTVRGTVAFLGAAVVAGPVVGAFVGAATVWWHRSGAVFWDVWQAWLLSNMLTGLTLLPLILMVCARGRSWLRGEHSITPARTIEGTVVLGALVCLGAWVFITSPRLTPASLYLPLPLLLWGAVRFGPVGAVVSIFALACLTIVGARRGHGPFVSGSPADNLIQLQYFLISMSVPLLLLATYVRQAARVTEALRVGEQRYRDVVECQTDLVCRFLPDSTITFVNGAYCRFFARSRESLLGSNLLDLLPESAREEAKRVVRSLVEGSRPEMVEHQVILPDGSVGWQQWMDHVVRDESGRVVELQGIGHDVTLQRRAEEALQESLQRVQDLAGSLITAQEAERARIAGELHDDVCQRLAALSIGLSMLRRRCGGELRAQAEDLQRGLTELTNELRDLSHDLHPGVLRHAGLGAALASRAMEFRQHHGIEVVVDAPGCEAIPPELALCLYRVAQEALQNIARHAKARRADIVVRCDGARASMTVGDDGQGFDIGAARARGGLGLISLEERVRVMGGNLTIGSAPRGGTMLRVDVPFAVTGRDVGLEHAALGGPGAGVGGGRA
jgi:PAS domain S-box-containing protein